MPGNSQALYIYHLSEDQKIVAPDGSTVGVLDSSIESIMRIHEVDDQAACHIKVKHLTRRIIRERAEAREIEKNASTGHR